MSIIRLGRFVPTSLREWDAVFRSLNGVINEDAAGNVTVEATVPVAGRRLCAVGANDTLPNERVLTGVADEVTVTDGGAGTTVELGLAAAGTAGAYTKVTTDAKGRVTAGTTLVDADIPASIARDSEVTAAVAAHEADSTDVHSAADYGQTDVGETLRARGSSRYGHAAENLGEGDQGRYGSTDVRVGGDLVGAIAVTCSRLERVAHRQCEQPAHGIALQRSDELAHVGRMQARARRIVDHHPVLVACLAVQGLESIRDRQLAACAAPASTHAWISGLGQSRKAAVALGQSDDDGADGTHGQQCPERPGQDRPAQQCSVLLGVTAAEALAATRCGHDREQPRAARHHSPACAVRFSSGGGGSPAGGGGTTWKNVCNDAVMLYNLSCVYCLLGDPGKAIESFLQAIDAGYGNYSWARIDPDLQPIRDDPRFVAAMAGK